jgi:hypothetical protein
VPGEEPDLKTEGTRKLSLEVWQIITLIVRFIAPVTFSATSAISGNEITRVIDR